MKPAYREAVAKLLWIVRTVRAFHGDPAFLMPPDDYTIPAPLDFIGDALADNDAAHAIVAKTRGEDYTLMMLESVLAVERIPYARAESLRAFLARIEERLHARVQIVPLSLLTSKGEPN